MGATCCHSSSPKPAPEHKKTDIKIHPIENPSLSHAPDKTLHAIDINAEDLELRRASKLGFSTVDHSKLIHGFLKEPLLSLEESLKPFHGGIDNLSQYIADAKKKCHFPSKHGLTRDESAAIYIYTMRWPGNCLYDHLQKAWSFQQRDKMKPWFRYLKLFKTGLDKLPDAQTEIWQGIPYDDHILEQVNSKSSHLYSTMSSCVLSPNKIKDYLSNNGHKAIILIGYESINVKSIADYGVNSHNEYIMEPGTKLGQFKVITSEKTGPALVLHLKSK